MNVLITGGTGFIGQHLLDELQADGLQLTVISRQASPKFWCDTKNFKVIQADIADKESIRKALTGIEAVINLAAELKKHDHFESTNITGTENLVELSEELGVKKIIHLSSVGVVGMQHSSSPLIVDETTQCYPKNGYERTKLESEMIIARGSIPYTILRPTNVFGDHHPRQTLLGLMQRIKNGSPIPMSEKAMVNYVYAKDVAHAIRFCLLNKIEDKTINIGQSMPLKKFVETIAAQLGVKPNIKLLPSFFLSAMDFFGYFGVEKVKERLRSISNRVEYSDKFMNKIIGYKYRVEVGISTTLSYYKLK